MTDGIANPILTRSLSEVDPYSLSARAFESASRSIFTEAGLGPGMRVLDVCSGSGDLALLLRELVGPIAMASIRRTN